MALFTEEDFNTWSERGNYVAVHEACSLAVQSAVGDMLRMLPFMIASLVKQAAELQEMSTAFYKQNGDLSEHKELVAKEIERLQSADVGAPLDEVIKRAAANVRGQLRRIGSVQNARVHGRF